MARKAPVSYAAVELEPVTATPAAPAVQPPPKQEADLGTSPVRRGRPVSGRTLKEAASPVMLYLNPRAAKALKRYALDEGTKVHSLLLDAVEAWFKSHGLREPVRVETGRETTTP
jgi:hypothetical protein